MAFKSVAGLIGGFLASDKQAASVNTAMSNGIYYIGSNGTDAPIKDDVGTLVVFRRSERIVQHYYSVSKGYMYVRVYSSGSWSSWKQIVYTY